jgi:hypothetical protein
VPTIRYLIWEHLSIKSRPLTAPELQKVVGGCNPNPALKHMLIKGHVTRQLRNTQNSLLYEYSATTKPPKTVGDKPVKIQQKQKQKQQQQLDKLISAAGLARCREFTSAPLVRVPL